MPASCLAHSRYSASVHRGQCQKTCRRPARSIGSKASSRLLKYMIQETGSILCPQLREEIGVCLLGLLQWGPFRALSCAWGTWHSYFLNPEIWLYTICQGVGGRESISIHCTQLFIWKSTSNVPIHAALLHFSTFMSVIAFIFLFKTAKQDIIYYITTRIGWVYSHNSSNPPSDGPGG